ncbi:clustered mitochondria-domain-containing protein [Xylaria bambusicola]|uniref:clustered mitochondria-domain-containing protein n=1 Tax=Xylaria bambusicola TaxID=326684 RepID=UPI0020074429|nr:clustered mitochondria-domain-containing protein [Xylaria bambusicola]KAI0526598.1 clustered mitochondria-domain-containing protein [Xylaria bambusicola]
MADNQEPQNTSAAEPAAVESRSVNDQPTAENNDEGVEEDVAEALFTLAISLPHEPSKIHVMVSPSEQVHELRQSVIELPAAFQYSCFHFEHDGERINDFVQISDVKGLGPEAEIRLVEDPYTEKEARIHVIRIRDLVGAAGDRTDTLQGVLAGASLFDSVTTESKNVDNAQASAYEFEALAKTSTLLPKVEESAPKTVKSISLSPWNPPPYHLRQKGHLLYLLVATNEGEQYQITSHVGGFFVNKSSNGKFDPSPRAAPKAYSAHSLLTLLSQISPSFLESFEQLLQFNNRKDPLATFQMTNAIPAAPWLVPSQSSPLCAHSSDITRTQEGYLLAGVDNTDTLRDWNEEFQAARELPKETVQDRVFRERFISKLFADYTDAAARGAILVARGEVTPLNPTEGRDAQIFVYNNVFFSFGADGVGTFTSEGGDDAARVATGKDVNGVRLVNQLDIDGLYSPATVVVDYLGKRIVGQTVVPGIFKQREPGENSIDYGAVEGKDVVAADERFAAPFEKLSQALRVKKHPVWDKDGKRFDLEASVETKGLMGTDGRKYVLDLYRITPLDVLWLEENDGDEENKETGYPHRMTVLRPELVESIRNMKWSLWVNEEVTRIKETTAKKLVEQEASADSTEEQEQQESQDADLEAKIDGSNFSYSLNPDAFSGQVPQTELEKKEMAADEEEVRNACKHLRDTIIPTFVGDIKSSELPFPMDGLSLAKMMHKRGINMRYLGTVVSFCEGFKLSRLRDLCLQEVISRAFKHVASKYLRYLPVPLTSACIAHLLNCLLGSAFNSKPIADIDESLKSLYPEADLTFANLTAEALRKEIEVESARRFKVTLNPDWHAGIKHLQLLRDISLKLGLQLQAKDFQFTGEPPKIPENVNEKSNGDGEKSNKKKKKKTRDGSPASIASSIAALCTFVADDIVNIVPIVKDSAPKSSISEEALEGGRHSIIQGNRKIGQELLLESLTLHEQIYGILHSEVARAYSTLAQIYYQLEEKEAAVDLARKAVIVSERTIGVDSAETLLYYLNLGLYLHGSGDSKAALAYVKHALDLWKVIYGPDHPDSITTLNNAAVMLQHMQAYHESRTWFEQALTVCERVIGPQSLQAASLLFQLAQALALDNEPKAALSKMRACYNIFREELGPENSNTKEAETWLDQLTQNAVAIAKRDKIRAGMFPTRTLGSSASASTTSKGLGHGRASVKQDDRSLDELIGWIEGSSAQKKSTKKRPGRVAPKTRVGAGASK